MAQHKHALIFGASGVSGWAFVNELLNDYPSKGIWSKVTALTNRPLAVEETMWPTDDRLQLVSGIDLLNGSQQDLENTIKSHVADVDTVTHLYYLGRYPSTLVLVEKHWNKH